MSTDQARKSVQIIGLPWRGRGKRMFLVFTVRQVCNLHSKYFVKSMGNRDILLRLPLGRDH